MTISVTYQKGKVSKFDTIDDVVPRNTFLASMMTVDEMRRFFTATNARMVAASLGYPSRGSEKAHCENIYNHFNTEV